MRDITINKTKLLTILKKNQTKHKELYNEAVTAWNGEVISFCKQLQKKAKTAVLGREDVELYDAPFSHRPISHVNDYDVTINMLELSEDDSIVLTTHEFCQYVRDEWSWKQDFISNASVYTSTVR